MLTSDLMRANNIISNDEMTSFATNLYMQMNAQKPKINKNLGDQNDWDAGQLFQNIFNTVHM